jgi:hypothetical protein
MATLGGIWSTIWRGFCGAILCYTVAGIASFLIGSLAWLIRDDFAYVKEAGSGLIGGCMGAEAGVWVLRLTLKRYPGRTIGWIYIAITALLLTILLIGTVWILVDPSDKPTLSGYLDKRTIFQSFSAIGESVIFYVTLIRPKINFMAEG